ncbi:sensor histidine kinase [Wenyingzhuangia aestuarii]|uniref:sensor histidine kinase n=1 Tax=Wenyingzhuangia aestuarii TaxID=1647582 RepID=UPI0014394C99|nr:histidine kinase [Wenyingzhuangia aestuarii]NJB83738.1 sensor histidine kinase YesM [Wenyingzhuangia aestuarii]
MNTTKRFISQLLFWLLIWLILWAQKSWDISFVRENTLSFLSQILIIASLVYYLIPQLLVEKKYLLFVSLSLVLLFVVSYVCLQFPDKTVRFKNMPRPPMGRQAARKFLSPRVFMTLLLLFSSYSLTTVIEILLFAQKKDEEIIRSKNENLQTELKLLKSQINPHFLFNSLNNIYALSVMDSNKTQQSISYLSDMLRYVLYECERAFVPIEKEIQYIENYLQLFSLKSSSKYPIEISYQIKNSQISIAPMLLIPFVENAIKHSNIERITDTFIHIELTEIEDAILFSVRNSIASSAISKDQVGGIGLENVKKRLSIIYPDQHTLAIHTEEGVFQVNLKLNKHV